MNGVETQIIKIISTLISRLAIRNILSAEDVIEIMGISQEDFIKEYEEWNNKK